MISETIKQIRNQQNLTQKQLAEKLYVSDKTVSSWENNRTIPDIYILEKLSRLADIPMNDLMKGEITNAVVFRYKVKQIYYSILEFIRINFQMLLIVLIGLSSYLIVLYSSSMISIWIHYGVLILSVLYISFKDIKYHLISLIPISVSSLPRLLATLSPTTYGQMIEGGNQDRIGIILSYIYLLGLLVVLLMTAYRFIKKGFDWLYIFKLVSFQILIWVIIYLVEISIRFQMTFDTWSMAWQVSFIKTNPYGWLSLCSFLILGSYLTTLVYKKANL